MQPTENLHVRATRSLVPPAKLKQQQPATEQANRCVVGSRETVKRILSGEDRRVMAIVGPCSIHDEHAAIEYAERLRKTAEKVQDRLFVVMRVYFEKPRTTVGWKGLINDPYLNDTFDIDEGFRIARRILLQVAEMGLPAATEMLEPITPQFIADLVSVTAIGARTTESPTHRQMASGLSMPVGFKNGTDGSLQVALDAMISAKSPHSFLGINDEGGICIVHTSGNPWGFLVLRGGRSGPNYSPESIADAAAKLAKAGLSPRVLVDCSHANSNKDHRLQANVWRNVVGQRCGGLDAAIGLMLESNLREGRQDLGADPKQLAYGVSITDACIGWEETEQLLLESHAELAASGK